VTAPAHRDIWLASLERWHRETGNPLYAWEAIAWCLSPDPCPIPDWCLAYLAQAARNVTDLSWAVGQGRMSPETAREKISQALLLTRRGANAFDRVPSDREAMRAALREIYGPDESNSPPSSPEAIEDRARELLAQTERILGVSITDQAKALEYYRACARTGCNVTEQIMKRRSISRDRARRIVAWGRRLLGNR
jgi:hypothetical protein